MKKAGKVHCSLLSKSLTAISNPPTSAAKNGAAARMTKIERASAHATTDLGQREKLVPLPVNWSEVHFCVGSMSPLTNNRPRQADSKVHRRLNRV